VKIYLGFDDTDVLGAEIGTGRLVRMFESKLPREAKLWGVVRHQLLVDPQIPYTSHNSPACAVVEIEDPQVDQHEITQRLIDLAAAHLTQLASPGSDPGLCVASADADLSGVIAFGLDCTHSVQTQANAKAVATSAGIHLSGHGGTNDGIIGATAAVGLTAFGWSGRFLEFGRLRQLPDPVSSTKLLAEGIRPVTLDRDATVLPPDTLIVTNGWVSPRLWAGVPILPVRFENGSWTAPGKKLRDEDPGGTGCKRHKQD
jgi:hypothetical protein